MADPQCWSIERGYHSGNPNMSYSYVLSLGVIACACRTIRGANLGRRATQWMDKWLTDEVGPNGEWLREGSHYGMVSLEPMIAYAIAAQRAGFRDFTDDPRLKKLLLYFAKTQTPRDPQRGNVRATRARGRGTTGDRLPLFAIAARMTAKADPDFSRTCSGCGRQRTTRRATRRPAGRLRAVRSTAAFRPGAGLDFGVVPEPGAFPAPASTRRTRAT